MSLSSVIRSQNERIVERPAHTDWRSALLSLSPLMAGALIDVFSAPLGLGQHSWYFVAVIVGLVREPIPAAAVGLVGVMAAAVLARFVLFSPEQLAQSGFNPNTAAISWALSGVSNPTVWLIFAAFVFSLTYEKTGQRLLAGARLLAARRHVWGTQPGHPPLRGASHDPRPALTHDAGWRRPALLKGVIVERH
jgi:hypothetical protein